MKKIFNRTIFFHPILFGVYPILALLAYNIKEIRPLVTLRAGLLSLLFCILLFLAVQLILRNVSKAAAASTFLLVMFYSYGQIYGLIEGRKILGFLVGRHTFLLTVWVVIIALGLWRIIKNTSDLKNLNQILNVVSVLLVIIPVFQAVVYEINLSSMNRQSANNQLTVTTTQIGGAKQSSEKPDVYYIILDMYTRADMLKQVYNYDNNPFIQQLTAKGFYVGSCSQSNYSFTTLSISSSLNMDYLEGFSKTIVEGKENLAGYAQHMIHSQVRKNFESMGYYTAAFETGYWNDELTDAKMYITRTNNPITGSTAIGSINNFEVLFLRTTLFRVIMEAQSSYLSKLTKQVETPEQDHYDRILFVLNQLDNLPSVPGPKFVYAHLVAPHPPFVLNSDGSYHSTTDNSGYTNGITYLDKRVLELVTKIISESRVPPIIIVQGDHGMGDVERVDIFNAYYLPNGGSKLLYPKISPVNSFRVVFDEYFGGKYPLLQDISRFSQYNDPYNFTVRPNNCVPPQ
jgi:hypothetical protein